MKISTFFLVILDGISESYLRGLYDKSNLKKNFKIFILSALIITSNPGTQPGIFWGRKGFLEEGLIYIYIYLIEGKAPHGKMSKFVFLDTFKNHVLYETLNP